MYNQRDRCSQHVVTLTTGHVGREMALSPVDVQRVPVVCAELHVLAVAARPVTVAAALRVARQAGVLSRRTLRGRGARLVVGGGAARAEAAGAGRLSHVPHRRNLHTSQSSRISYRQEIIFKTLHVTIKRFCDYQESLWIPHRNFETIQGDSQKIL